MNAMQLQVSTAKESSEESRPGEDLEATLKSTDVKHAVSSLEVVHLQRSVKATNHHPPL